MPDWDHHYRHRPDRPSDKELKELEESAARVETNRLEERFPALQGWFKDALNGRLKMTIRLWEGNQVRIDFDDPGQFGFLPFWLDTRDIDRLITALENVKAKLHG